MHGTKAIVSLSSRAIQFSSQYHIIFTVILCRILSVEENTEFSFHMIIIYMIQCIRQKQCSLFFYVNFNGCIIQIVTNALLFSKILLTLFFLKKCTFVSFVSTIKENSAACFYSLESRERQRYLINTQNEDFHNNISIPFLVYFLHVCPIKVSKGIEQYP